MRRDERGIVIAWLMKIMVSLAVLAVTVFEAGAIIVATVGVDGDADVAAREAALEYGRTRDRAAACRIAEDTARRSGSTMKSCELSAEGTAVIVTLERPAKTKIVQHIGPLEKFTAPTATARSPIR